MMAGGDNRIKCIFFSEFHHIAGPKITFQVPEDYLSKEIFDSLSVYIITKPQLQNRLITINALGHKIIGYPVVIDNPKYARNALIFNLCFTCDAAAKSCQYEPIVKKLACYLVSLENECGYLSSKEGKCKLHSILLDMLNQLNFRGHCAIPINESTTIYLKVVQATRDPPVVKDHDVPIFLINKDSFIFSQWDLTSQQLLPYIDGFNHIARIASEADVQISLVKACVQHMVYYGVAMLIPIFQYTNVYTTTPEINKLAENKTLQEDCIKYVVRTGAQVPTFRDVFMLYCGLCPGMTVRDLCTRYNPHALRVDERKLIQFGVMKTLIRRMKKYPIQLTSEPHASNRQRNLSKWFNGCHSYDEICCKNNFSYQELDDKVESDPYVVVCWK